jgi:hypothetical protein
VCVCVCTRVCSTGVWTQGLALARQGLYHLSHNPRPFIFKVEPLAFAHEGPVPQSSCLHFLCSWDDRHKPPHPAFFFWLRWFSLFCLGLASNHHLHLLINWDYKVSHQTLPVLISYFLPHCVWAALSLWLFLQLFVLNAWLICFHLVSWQVHLHYQPPSESCHGFALLIWDITYYYHLLLISLIISKGYSWKC